MSKLSHGVASATQSHNGYGKFLSKDPHPEEKPTAEKSRRRIVENSDEELSVSDECMLHDNVAARLFVQKFTV